MREARRLALLERQMLIAEVARKQALRALAEGLEAEAKSGAALAARSGFTAGLAQLAVQAEAAARDAALQRAWQTDALARAETRAKRLAEMTAEARAALAAAQARREAARELPLARKLQSRPADGP